MLGMTVIWNGDYLTPEEKSNFKLFQHSAIEIYGTLHALKRNLERETFPPSLGVEIL